MRKRNKVGRKPNKAARRLADRLAGYARLLTGNAERDKGYTKPGAMKGKG